MASLNHSRYSLPKSPSWLRVEVQIGFGVIITKESEGK